MPTSAAQSSTIAPISAASYAISVHGALELEGALAPVGILFGETAEPVGAHLHVGDFVGEHPVFAELEHRVARLVAERLHRVENVDREPFERAVHAAQPQHGVGIA